MQPKVIEYSMDEVRVIRECALKFRKMLEENQRINSFQELSVAIKMGNIMKLLRKDTDIYDKTVPSFKEDPDFNGTHFSHLVILPHGMLTSLPIHIIPTTVTINVTTAASTTAITTTNEKSLNDTFGSGVFYLPSLQFMKTSAKSIQNKLVLSNLLAVQDPTMKLIGAATEVAEISIGFESCVVLKQNCATIQDFRDATQQASPNSTLHFACHGVFDQQARWNTQLQLDEPLTVADIVLSDLKKFNMCVLSACESAVSDASVNNYDDHISIASSFIVAGVPRVLSALWKVDDTATALLMIQLYRAIKEAPKFDARASVSLTTALTQAQYYLRTMKGKDVKTQVKHQRALTRATDLSSLISLTYVIRWTEFSDNEEQAMQVIDESIAACNRPQPIDRNPGEKFDESKWQEFLQAFHSRNVDDCVLVHSHVFPMLSDETKHGGGLRYIPERDLWFRYRSLLGDQQFAILHVHYLSTWPNVNEDEIAQVNIRFPNKPGKKYQFEPVLQCGITYKGYVLTHPQWMDGKRGNPSIWRWKEEPVRFKDVYDVLESAEADISNRAFVKITVPMKYAVGGHTDIAAIDDESCPFEDPYYWAGWIVTGDVVQAGGGIHEALPPPATPTTATPTTATPAAATPTAATTEHSSADESAVI